MNAKRPPRNAARKQRFRKPLSLRQRRRVLLYMPMVERIARQNHKTLFHVPIEDLIQSGMVGLIEAVQRYIPSIGPFENFAWHRINGAMFDAHKRSAFWNDTHQRALFESQESAHPADRGPLPDQIADRRKQHRLLAQAVAELERSERQVIRAWLKGASVDEVAEICGRSAPWVRLKLAKAQEQLAARLSNVLSPDRSQFSRAVPRRFLKSPTIQPPI